MVWGMLVRALHRADARDSSPHRSPMRAGEAPRVRLSGGPRAAPRRRALERALGQRVRRGARRESAHTRASARGLETRRPSAPRVVQTAPGYFRRRRDGDDRPRARGASSRVSPWSSRENAHARSGRVITRRRQLERAIGAGSALKTAGRGPVILSILYAGGTFGAGKAGTHARLPEQLDAEGLAATQRHNGGWKSDFQSPRA